MRPPLPLGWYFHMIINLYTHYPLKLKPGKPYEMTTKGKFSALQCPQNNVFTTKDDQHLYFFQLLRALRNIVQLGLGLS